MVGARAATLSFMVGGPQDTFEAARPFLEKYVRTSNVPLNVTDLFG